MRKWLIISTIVITIGTISYILLGNAMEKGLTPQADGTNDYLIILGAKVRPTGEPSLSLQNRLDAAVDYMEKYPHVTAIVSGGQGKDEPETEAAVMANYLIERGIDAQRILREEQSTSTYENFLFSKELLAEDVTHITIVSNDYHLYRAKYLADVVGLEADVIAAPTPNVVRGKAMIRERLAILKTYVVGH